MPSAHQQCCCATRLGRVCLPLRVLRIPLPGLRVLVPLVQLVLDLFVAPAPPTAAVAPGVHDGHAALPWALLMSPASTMLLACGMRSRCWVSGAAAASAERKGGGQPCVQCHTTMMCGPAAGRGTADAMAATEEGASNGWCHGSSAYLTLGAGPPIPPCIANRVQQKASAPQ